MRSRQFYRSTPKSSHKSLCFTIHANSTPRIEKLTLILAATSLSRGTEVFSPITIAEQRDEVIPAFLRASGKFDIESKDRFNRTPLSWAAQYGYNTVVKLLMEESGKPESKDDNGQTPLSYAAQNKYEAVVKRLLDKGVVDLESKDDNGLTPLSWAEGRV